MKKQLFSDTGFCFFLTVGFSLQVGAFSELDLAHLNSDATTHYQFKRQ